VKVARTHGDGPVVFGSGTISGMKEGVLQKTGHRKSKKKSRTPEPFVKPKQSPNEYQEYLPDRSQSVIGRANKVLGGTSSTSGSRLSSSQKNDLSGNGESIDGMNRKVPDVHNPLNNQRLKSSERELDATAARHKKLTASRGRKNSSPPIPRRTGPSAAGAALTRAEKIIHKSIGTMNVNWSLESELNAAQMRADKIRSERPAMSSGTASDTRTPSDIPVPSLSDLANLRSKIGKGVKKKLFPARNDPAWDKIAGRSGAGTSSASPLSSFNYKGTSVQTMGGY